MSLVKIRPDTRYPAFRLAWYPAGRDNKILFSDYNGAGKLCMTQNSDKFAPKSGQ
jgi:hypothetical protein